MNQNQECRLPCLRLHQLHHAGEELTVTPLSSRAASAVLDSDAQDEASLFVDLQPPGLRISDATSGEDVFWLPLLFAEAELRFRAHKVDRPVIVLKHGMVLRHAQSNASEEPDVKGQAQPSLREDEGQFWLIVVDGDQDGAKLVLDAFGASGTICRSALSSFNFAEEKLGIGERSTLHRVKRCRAAGDFDDSAALKITKSPQDEKLLRSLISEVAMLVASQGHPNIIKYQGLFCFNEDQGSTPVRSPQFAIMMQYCSGGDLFTFAQHDAVPESQAQQVMTGLLSALSHMHQRGLVHRDVKPENVMLDKSGQPVLIDFGIAARLSDTMEMRRKCGSPGYVAPEVLLGDTYGIEVDSFGAGAVLYFILCQRPPFASSSISSIITKTISSPVKFKKPAFQVVQLECIMIMQCLLHKNPRLRLTAKAALADPWILSTVSCQSMAKATIETSVSPSQIADSAVALEQTCNQEEEPAAQ